MLTAATVPAAAAAAAAAVAAGRLAVAASSRCSIARFCFFQAFFFAVCLVVPLLWLLLLALLWLVPLRPATQRRLLVAAEVAHAWSALDVFLLTLVRACVSACVRTHVSA